MVSHPIVDHIDHNYNKCHRTCVVPLCPSTTEKTPEKLFVLVPSAAAAREEWLRLAGCLSLPSGTHYFCEDHFDIQNDMLNYTEYKIMGHVQRVRLKVGCLPSRFACQKHHKMLPADDQKTNMFKFNVVQGKNVLTIETVPQTVSGQATEAKKKVINCENVTIRVPKKSTIIKVKKGNAAQETIKKRPVIIKPNFKKVRIIKKI